MFSALKKILGIQTTDDSRKSTEASSFSGSAYFSNRVPRAFVEKWVAHGGEISRGTTFDVRARYFFAIDPSEPWVTKLFAKSVVVIHAGWIVHCIDEAFQVPLAEYILDDRFVPGPPYKLTNIAPMMYTPLSEPGGPTDSESGSTPVQASDTPSTPTGLRRKRKREQAYFDSPSGSLVYSGFDKDGLPRRPRKQRMLRFDPSFNLEGERSGKETTQMEGLYWLRDHLDTSRDDDKLNEEQSQETGAYTLCGPSHTTMVRSCDTPDKPLAYEGPFAPYRRCLSSHEHLSKPTRPSSPAIPIATQNKTPLIRAIDFTNLPPPTRRWRFPQPDATNSAEKGMIRSIEKPTEHKVKTPKKISFANHAQVCVYKVSPQRSDTKDSADPGPARQCFGEGLENGPKVNGKTRASSDEVGDSDDSNADAIKDLVPQIDSAMVNNDPARLLGGDQYENGTLTLTLEDVQEKRRRLLDSVAKNSVDDGQLAVLFKPGNTFQGMTFRHVW